LYGVIRVTQQVLPIMRRQKGGRIINVSLGGIVGYPFSAAPIVIILLFVT
jgi:NADP-dependent 3-hydroxy acid dehydrogenase YdfG